MDGTMLDAVGAFVRTLQGETGTNFADFDDLVQDCCLRVIEQSDKFEGKNGCKRESFVYNVVRNHLINYKRFHCRMRRDYRRTVNGDITTENFTDNYEGNLPSDSSVFENFIGRDFSPEHYLEREELIDRIGSLTPRRRKRLQGMIDSKHGNSVQSRSFYSSMGRFIGVEETKRRSHDQN